MATTVRLSDELTAAADEAAARAGVTRSKWVQTVVAEAAARSHDVQSAVAVNTTTSAATLVTLTPLVAAPVEHDETPLEPVVSSCRHRRWWRVGGVCTRCGEKVS